MLYGEASLMCIILLSKFLAVNSAPKANKARDRIMETRYNIARLLALMGMAGAINPPSFADGDPQCRLNQEVSSGFMTTNLEYPPNTYDGSVFWEELWYRDEIKWQESVGSPTLTLLFSYFVDGQGPSRRAQFSFEGADQLSITIGGNRYFPDDTGTV